MLSPVTNSFTDSHCHLDFPEFADDLTTILTNCQQANIKRIIVPSIAPKNWQQVLHLSKQFSGKNLSLLACLGIHPWFLNELSDSDLDALKKLASHHQAEIIAIGEAGIDGVIAQQHNNLHKQLHFFEYQLNLAHSLAKPIIVHHRKSHAEIVNLLKRHPLPKGGIIHAFSGSYQQAKAYLDLGFKLGIGGTISYERAQKTINTVKKLPLDSILLETDAPAMPLSGEQGQANTPLNVVKVFDILCSLRAETPEIINQQLEQNYQTLFNF